MNPVSPTLIAERHRPATIAGPASVTVVITCYNYARFLRQAALSALTQNDVQVDVVIVDDSSTDESLAVARELAAADPRVHVLANEQNRGAVESFNRGLSEASGEFLVRLDADDVLTPGSLARAVAVMQALPHVGLVYGHPLHFSGDKLPPARSVTRSWTVWHGRDWLVARCLAANNVITSPEVVMRGTVVDQVGGQRPLAHTHDMEMWLRISARADIAYVNGVDQAWHREHPASLSSEIDDQLSSLQAIRDAFDVLFDGLGSDFESGAQLLAEARGSLAREALVQVQRILDRGERTVEVEELHAFARDCDPGICATREWRSQHQPSPSVPALARATGLPRRAVRWLGHRIRKRRWHRTGVYERLRTRPPESIGLQSQGPARTGIDATREQDGAKQ